jgi:hypothetical protein
MLSGKFGLAATGSVNSSLSLLLRSAARPSLLLRSAARPSAVGYLVCHRTTHV